MIQPMDDIEGEGLDCLSGWGFIVLHLYACFLGGGFLLVNTLLKY